MSGKERKIAAIIERKFIQMLIMAKQENILYLADCCYGAFVVSLAYTLCNSIRHYAGVFTELKKYNAERNPSPLQRRWGGRRSNTSPYFSKML
jgi:hypothetical protein